MPKRWIEIPDVPLPFVSVDAHPLVGIYINREWKTALLSLVQHADQARFWDTTASEDFVKQQAYLLFREIRQATGMIGAIVPYATTNPPTGTLPCDGSTHNRADYPALYAALPPALQNGDTFTTPDLRGLFILSAGAGYTPYDTGGAVSVTLDESQMPPHAHDTAPHDHTYTRPTFGIDIESVGVPDPTGVGNPPFTDTTFPALVEVLPAGGGQPHDNMPPYIALAYAIVAL
jgi:microcystin-dependent protein